jgi:drug/metabolite transporter (DMT)-like permease
VADVAWGVLGGLVSVVAIALLYACLAIGPMSILSPLTAVVSAVVPMSVGLLAGDRLAPIGYWALGLALVAVVLIAAEGGLSSLRTARPGALTPALAAGACFGFFFVLLDRTAEDAGLTPLASARVASVAFVALLALAGGRSLRVPWAALPIVVLAGVGDMTANALFLLATQQGGQLAIVGVLASLYPASTVLLAQLVLRERLAGTQLAGLMAAAAAVALIALPG